jgi:hypothetical protein
LIARKVVPDLSPDTLSKSTLLTYTVATNYDIDHIIPLAQHWSLRGGNDNTPEIRRKIAGGRGNLRLMWGPLNRSRGAEGAAYMRFVRREFESDFTRQKGYQWADEDKRFTNYED